MVTINVTLGLSCTIVSFGFFLLCRYLIRPLTNYRLFTDKTDNEKNAPSPSFQTWLTDPNEKRWQRLNLLISWLHALITGVLVLYSFLAYPDLRNDFVEHVNLVTYVTCSLSFGRQKTMY